MDSREERYKTNNLSRQARNAKLYEQIYENVEAPDKLPLSKNEIYITKMQTEISTRDEYRKNRHTNNIKEEPRITYEERLPINEVEENVYDINKVLDKVKADKVKEDKQEDNTKQDYLKKLNIDNINEVKNMYEDMIGQVDQEVESKLQKTANLSLEILSDLKGDNDTTMISAPIKEDELPEIEKTKKMNFYTGDVKFNKRDFENNDEDDNMSDEFVTSSKKKNTLGIILLFLFIILITMVVLYYLNKTGRI